MFGDGIRYGYIGKSEKKVAKMKLIKFTRNKLKLYGFKDFSSKSAHLLIRDNYYVGSKHLNMYVQIQKDFAKYREWLITYCENNKPKNEKL